MGVGSGGPALVEHGFLEGASFQMGQEFGFAVETGLDVGADSLRYSQNLLGIELDESTTAFPTTAVARVESSQQRYPEQLRLTLSLGAERYGIYDNTPRFLIPPSSSDPRMDSASARIKNRDLEQRSSTLTN
ncbi:hypothetical protein Pssp01_12090 [Pseudomonas sp. NBRC 100443]|nr:hypothetical protein Pssp01_12090 [Pseudomonas sp. NBRC 100443]